MEKLYKLGRGAFMARNNHINCRFKKIVLVDSFDFACN